MQVISSAAVKEMQDTILLLLHGISVAVMVYCCTNCMMLYILLLQGKYLTILLFFRTVRYKTATVCSSTLMMHGM